MQRNAGKREDPWYQAKIEQLAAWFAVVEAVGEPGRAALVRAWCMSWGQLAKAKCPWMVAKGPLAATQAILTDAGWQAPSFSEWRDKKGQRWALDFAAPELLFEVKQVSWKCMEAQQGLAQCRSSQTVEGLKIASMFISTRSFLSKHPLVAALWRKFCGRVQKAALWQPAAPDVFFFVELTLHHMYS